MSAPRGFEPGTLSLEVESANLYTTMTYYGYYKILTECIKSILRSIFDLGIKQFMYK